MTIQELQVFLSSVQSALNERFGKDESKAVQVLSCMTKLSEEVGELAEQVLLWKGKQDARKGDFEIQEMEKEIADLIFSAGMIAHAMDIDLEQALSQKMKRIQEKFSM